MNQPYGFLSIEQFNELINQWSDKKIKISKLERDDLDEIVMHLDQIAYGNEMPSIDGYEPHYNLQLNGTGQIQTDNNISQPLPTDLYQIPIKNDTLYEFDGSQFIISTDRGIYKIEKSVDNSF